MPARLVLALSLACTACVGPDIPALSDADAVVSADIGGLHVVRAGRGSQARLLFLHGTPGSWEGFSWYLEDALLTERYTLFAVDRPGFGRSRLPLMPSLQDQAWSLRPLCKAAGPFIVVGHSLGVSLALALAIRQPDCVQAVVSIAGSVAARYEAPRWFNRLAAQPWLRWLVPDALQRANREVLALPRELRRLEPDLPALEIPVILIQGGRDRLVDPRSAALLAQRMGRRAQLRAMPDQGHFVLWEAPEHIRSELLRVTDEVLD